MTDWPLFDTLYAAETLHQVPAYREGTTVLVLVLVLWSVVVLQLARRKQPSALLSLVLLRPRALSHLSAYAPPRLFFPLAIPHTAVMAGLTVCCALYRDTPLDLFAFGTSVARYALLFGVLTLGATLVYLLITRTFGDGDAQQLWFMNHFLLITLFGQSLYLPVLLMLYSSLPTVVPLLLAGLLFVLFRVWSFVRFLAIFKVFRRYPMHIILYLCACEIEPLFFIILSSGYRK